MNGTFEASKTVAFDIIREQLADLANSAEAREMARGLVPCMEEGELRRSMRDTTQARQMLELAGTPPMPAMEHTAEFVARSVRGELLTPEEIVTHYLPLADAERAYKIFEKREEECRKVILVPGAETPDAAAQQVKGLVNAFPGGVV